MAVTSVFASSPTLVAAALHHPDFPSFHARYGTDVARGRGGGGSGPAPDPPQWEPLLATGSTCLRPPVAVPPAGALAVRRQCLPTLSQMKVTAGAGRQLGNHRATRACWRVDLPERHGGSGLPVLAVPAVDRG